MRTASPWSIWSSGWRSRHPGHDRPAERAAAAAQISLEWRHETGHERSHGGPHEGRQSAPVISHLFYDGFVHHNGLMPSLAGAMDRAHHPCRWEGHE
jgi:hypothetical protein